MSLTTMLAAKKVAADAAKALTAPPPATGIQTSTDKPLDTGNTKVPSVDHNEAPPTPPAIDQKTPGAVIEHNPLAANTKTGTTAPAQQTLNDVVLEQDTTTQKSNVTESFSGAAYPANVGMVLEDNVIRPESFTLYHGDTAPEGSFVVGSLRQLTDLHGNRILPVDGLYKPTTEWQSKELAYFAAKNLGYVMTAAQYNKGRAAKLRK